MGQKVNPHGLRIGVVRDWDSRWHPDKRGYGDYLVTPKTFKFRGGSARNVGNTYNRMKIKQFVNVVMDKVTRRFRLPRQWL